MHVHAGKLANESVVLGVPHLNKGLNHYGPPHQLSPGELWSLLVSEGSCGPQHLTWICTSANLSSIFSISFETHHVLVKLLPHNLFLVSSVSPQAGSRHSQRHSFMCCCQSNLVGNRMSHSFTPSSTMAGECTFFTCCLRQIGTREVAGEEVAIRGCSPTFEGAAEKKKNSDNTCRESF